MQTRTLPLSIALAVAVALNSGCTTMKVPKDTAQSAAAYPNQQSRDGVTVALQPLTDKAEIKRTFNCDLLAHGVLPVLVVAQNDSDAASYLISREKVLLQDDDSSPTTTSQRKSVSSETPGAALTLVGVAAISLPLVVVGLKMASDATVIQHILAEKELFKRTLAPGQSAHGFVYFPFPEKTAISGRHRFVVELINLKSDEPVGFVFNQK